jgi:hypothetical protein
MRLNQRDSNIVSMTGGEMESESVKKSLLGGANKSILESLIGGRVETGHFGRVHYLGTSTIPYLFH